MNEIKLLELEKTDYKKKFFKFLLSQIVGTWGGGEGAVSFSRVYPFDRLTVRTASIICRIFAFHFFFFSQFQLFLMSLTFFPHSSQKSNVTHIRFLKRMWKKFRLNKTKLKMGKNKKQEKQKTSANLCFLS